MAVEYGLIVQDDGLTNETLLQVLNKLGLECSTQEEIKRGGLAICQFQDKIGFAIYLTDSSTTL